MPSIYELWSHELSNTQLVALEDLGPVQIFSDPSANQGLQIWICSTRRLRHEFWMLITRFCLLDLEGLGLVRKNKTGSEQ